MRLLIVISILVLPYGHGMDSTTKTEDEDERDATSTLVRTTFEMNQNDLREYLEEYHKAHEHTFPIPKRYVPELSEHSIAKRLLWKEVVYRWVQWVPIYGSHKSDVLSKSVVMEPFGGRGIHNNKEGPKIEKGSIVAAFEAACFAGSEEDHLEFYIGEYDGGDGRGSVQEASVRHLMSHVVEKARFKEACSFDMSSIVIAQHDFTNSIIMSLLFHHKYRDRNALMMVDPYKSSSAPMDSLVAFFTTSRHEEDVRTLIMNVFLSDILSMFKEV